MVHGPSLPRAASWKRERGPMPAGFSLSSNLRLPKIFGGNGICNADAAPAARTRSVLTGRCESDVYGTQAQRRENDLKEVERIKEIISRLEATKSSGGCGHYHGHSRRAYLGKKQQEHAMLPDKPLDDGSDGLEARMRAEFVMIKERLRKMEKDLQQLGSTTK